MIEIQDVTKSYSSSDVETTALDRVSLSIASGDFVAIMGPSGCGKSTLLNVLGLLDTPSSGRYVFDGADVSQASERQRADMRKGTLGFVFQSFNLIDDLNVYENVEMPLLYLELSRAERRARTEAALERVGMAHRRGHFPQQLSGGQQQRVAVARAVVSGPKLILADEPTGNLDSQHGGEVMRLLAEFNEAGSTIVMVTHSPADAEFAHRITYLLDGRVVTEDEIRSEYALPPSAESRG